MTEYTKHELLDHIIIAFFSELVMTMETVIKAERQIPKSSRREKAFAMRSDKVVHKNSPEKI